MDDQNLKRSQMKLWVAIEKNAAQLAILKEKAENLYMSIPGLEIRVAE
jgi:hypothetical protein